MASGKKVKRLIRFHPAVDYLLTTEKETTGATVNSTVNRAVIEYFRRMAPKKIDKGREK